MLFPGFSMEDYVVGKAFIWEAKYSWGKVHHAVLVLPHEIMRVLSCAAALGELWTVSSAEIL